MKFKIDIVRIRENSIQLNGWVIGKTPESKPAFAVLDEEHRKVKIRYVSTRRDDVSQIYYKKIYDRDFGFDIQFPYERGRSYWLLIRCDGKIRKMKFNEELIAKRSSVAHKRMEKIRDLMNMETVRVALEFGKKHGLKALFLKSKHKLQGLDNDYEYAEWYDLTKPAEEELARQRAEDAAGGPVLSLVMPVYKAPAGFLREMLDSILAQTYPNWELCIADGSPEGEDSAELVRGYAETDSRRKTAVFPPIPTRPSRRRAEIISYWPTRTTPCRSTRSTRSRKRSASTRTATCSIRTRIRWIWTAGRCSTRISSRILTRIFCAASIISAISSR